MAFTSRLAIITGGLGGLGSAVGKLLRSQGAQLALFHAPFEAAKVEPVLNDVFNVSRDQSEVRTYECDITSPTSINSAFAALDADITTNKSGPRVPSMLVNAAGYITLSPMEETPPEDTIKHLHVNLLGPMLASQAFARMYFRAREREGGGGVDAIPPARIVNIASQAAHVALANHSAYCASKAGLVGLTRSMASEWGGRGIIANSVSPGPVWTELGKKAWADDEVRGEYLKAVPNGRFGEPEEIAEMIVWLCRDGAGAVNGADFRIDGGFTAR